MSKTTLIEFDTIYHRPVQATQRIKPQLITSVWNVDLAVRVGSANNSDEAEITLENIMLMQSPRWRNGSALFSGSKGSRFESGAWLDLLFVCLLSRLLFCKRFRSINVANLYHLTHAFETRH